MNYKVTAKRHVAKTISYRLLSTGIGFTIMWWATGSIKIGAAFGVVELVYKPIQYYIHERVWYRWIKFGLVADSEKKKKVKGLTESKINNLPKVFEDELPETSLPVKPTGKKVLNYSSNR